ncbi:VanZ family protein [Mucilaginibacter sp. SP1R1]|uniref:VanZ family protein n=1 Tax=Mucilaginibacter sp. SP1R1 TaxID=2723091 RepID=UPI0016221EA6|nr:VanZ family protein [Mucilaginibacter sp. SP1R1]MBB6150245.1 VanZ family protein [Mucilaginibacter sp. SP1R1]
MCSADLGDVGDSPMFFAGFDKLTHTGFFFTWVVLVCSGIIRQQKPVAFSYKQAIAVTLVAIAFGGLIELLQLYIFTWRSADWNDLFADSLGACMGIFGVMVTVLSIGDGKK